MPWSKFSPAHADEADAEYGTTTAPLAASKVTRHAGANRLETAILGSRYNFQRGADFAIVASGRDFPDALSAASFSAILHKPILLTQPGELNGATSAYIEKHKPNYRKKLAKDKL